MQSLNPATGEIIAEFEELTDTELESRLARAASAFQRHRRTSFAERAERLERLAELLESRARSFGRLMTEEMGKPIAAAVAEAGKCAWACRLLRRARRAASWPTSRSRRDAARASSATSRSAPVLAVMPWNFPFWQVIRFAAPALMAGNVGLLKHALERPAVRAGDRGALPARRLPGGRLPDAADRLDARSRAVIDDPRVAAVTLTGSEPAGSAVAARGGRSRSRRRSSSWAAATRSSSCRAPTWTRRSRRRSRRASSTTGSPASPPSASSSHEAVADEFETRFVERDGGAQGGRPAGPGHRRRPAGHASDPRRASTSRCDERSQPARALLVGGERPSGPGFFYPPTVLADVRRGIAGLRRGDRSAPSPRSSASRDVDEAIALANDTPFGLGRSVVDERRGASASASSTRSKPGSVFVNAHGRVRPAPALRRRQAVRLRPRAGAVGIREFVNAKTIWGRRGGRR